MKNRHGIVAKLEVLELRRLLSSGGSAVLGSDGTLTLTATNGDDNISLGEGGAAINGSAFDFDPYRFEIRRVVVNALGGNDTVLVGENSGEGTPVTVNLGAGNDTVLDWDYFSTVFGGAGNDTVQLHEAAMGGDSTTNTAFDGGSGTDTLDVLDSDSSLGGLLDVDLVHEFPNVENVLHAHGNVIGNSADNYITLESLPFPELGGYQYVSGGGGNDTVVGSFGNPDYIDGGKGDDVFVSPPDGSTLVGGGGSDTVDYSLANADLTVDLTKGIGGVSGFAQDTLVGIENVNGGSGNDTLIGDGNHNVLNGGDGNDTIIGNGGKDLLIGGTGDDVFYAQDKKRDTILGNDGIDTAFADKQDKLIDVEVVAH